MSSAATIAPTGALYGAAPSRDRLLEAWEVVRSRRGAAGIDRITVEAFERDLYRQLLCLGTELLTGTYAPMPLRRVIIPKPNGGGTRSLGIPTVRDRIAQNALLLTLMPEAERQFLDCSYGYRFDRNAHQAIAVLEQLRDAGYRFVVSGTSGVTPRKFPFGYSLRIDGENRRGVLDDVVERSLKSAALWDEVKERLDASALELSGGQQQRLCIARSIAADPEVLLMDEPCSALDPIATSKIEELIFSLRGEYTVLIVTHNMQQAARVSDYTAFMYLGLLVEVSPTNVMFLKPARRQSEEYVTGRFG